MIQPATSSAKTRFVRLAFPKLPLVGKWIATYRLKKYFPLSVMRRHGFIVAKSGSGKSELLKLLLIAIMWEYLHLNRKRSVVLIDPHGDVADECARQRMFFRDYAHSKRCGIEPDLVFISLGLAKSSFPTLNPFDIRSKGYGPHQIEVMAQYLTGAFTAMLSKGDVRLSLQMKTLLTPMFSVLLQRSLTGDTPSTFFDLERFLDDTRNEDLITAGMRSDHEGIRRFFEHLFGDPKFQPTKFSLRVKLASLLNTHSFARLLAQEHSSWDLESLMNGGNTIIIDASKSMLGEEVSEIYGRTITALAQSYAFMRGGRTKRTPTFMIIDEAASFVSEDLKTILSQARKFGLHLILANQIARQGGIGTEFHETIMGNTALKVVGTAGSTTRRLMARECETHEDTFRDLRVGEFAVKANGSALVRVKLPEYWLGNRNAMSNRQWQEIKLWMLREYYQKNDETHPLSEEIHADRQSVRSSRAPLHGKPRPTL